MREHHTMLNRAFICIQIALVAALLGFTGLLQVAAPLAQALCYVFLAFAVLSFLFCLFEDCGTAPEERPLDSREFHLKS
jgi:uncharacterized membrane protein YtjA (UPF0391 family)